MVLDSETFDNNSLFMMETAAIAKIQLYYYNLCFFFR